MSRDERPRWRVNERSFIGHSQVEEGTEVFYTPAEGGEVHENLSPLNDAAQAIVDGQKSAHPDKAAAPAKKAAKPPAEPEGDGPVASPKGATKKAAKPAAEPKGAPEGKGEAKPADDEDVG